MAYRETINFLVFNNSSKTSQLETHNAPGSRLNADRTIHRFVPRPNSMLKTTLKSSKHHRCYLQQNIL